MCPSTPSPSPNRPPKIKKTGRAGLTVAEIVIFAMLGAMMYASKILMEILPNIHLLGMFTVTLTVVYRRRALYPIFVYIFLQAVTAVGYWWIPYIYIWPILWAAVMLLPRNMSPRVAMVVYPLVCSLHGFLFGVLYAPFEALLHGLDLQATLIWIANGFFGFDIIHGISNFCAGLLIVPLAALIRKLDKHLRRA